MHSKQILLSKEVELFGKLEEYNKNILKNKWGAVEEQIALQSECLDGQLEMRLKIMRDDMKKIKNKHEVEKKPTILEEVNSLVKTYKSKVKNKRFTINNVNIEMEKIFNFREKNSMTTIELIRYFDEKSFFSGKISLNSLKKSMLKYRVLNDDECDKLFSHFKFYFNYKEDEENYIRNDVFETILDENYIKRHQQEKDDNNEDEEEQILDLMKEYNNVKDLSDKKYNDLPDIDKNYLKV